LIRTRRFSYAERLGREPWLLFDDWADPGQAQNLIGSPAYADVQTELTARLGRWLERTNDPFLDTEAMVDHAGMTAAWHARQEHPRNEGPGPEDI
jgi:hypothetical protein